MLKSKELGTPKPMGSRLTGADVSPFETWLELLRRNGSPEEWRDALIIVNDTMEGALRICRSMFGEQFTADHVIAVYDRVSAEFLRRQSAAPGGSTP